MVTISASDCQNKSNPKIYTYKFKIMHVDMADLKNIMNQSAVSSPIYYNEHRKANNVLNNTDVYFIDVDDKDSYSNVVEHKLKQLNLDFVSVPSQSANLKPYKRHFAIRLSKVLPNDSNEYKEYSKAIIEQLELDYEKIDKRVASNIASFLAPASANKDFINYDDTSYYHKGDALDVKYQSNIKSHSLTTNNRFIRVDEMTFVQSADYGHISLKALSELVKTTGKKLHCSCPVNNPLHTSNNKNYAYGSFYNGNVYFHCRGDQCKDKVYVLHQHYEKHKTILDSNVRAFNIAFGNHHNKVIDALGTPHLEKDGYIIYFTAPNESIEFFDIANGKHQLQKLNYRIREYELSNMDNPTGEVIDIEKLKQLYDPNEEQLKVSFIRAKNVEGILHRIANVYNFNYSLSVEVIIYQALAIKTQNAIEIAINKYERVLKQIESEKDIHNSDRKFKQRLNPIQRKKAQHCTQSLIKRQNKATTRLDKVKKLVTKKEFQFKNKNPNATKIADYLNVSASSIKRDLKKLNI